MIDFFAILTKINAFYRLNQYLSGMNNDSIENRPQVMAKSRTIPFNASKTTGVQRFRFYSQLFSVAINVWIGLQFYFFVNYIESGGESAAVARPPGVDAWLPIGSLVSLRHWWDTGNVNDIHPAGLIIFVTILIVAFLFKKGFCSWICPIGFISEVLGDISDKIWRRRLKPPAWLDWPLRSLKYIIAGFFLYAILYQMSSADIEGFIYTDYNKVADLLMLRFFTDITMFALAVITILFVLSLIIRGFWCRFLCPYGALLGLIGMISPTRIVRSAESCSDCNSCAAACPSFIRVDKVSQVISDECTGCMACVDSCPVGGALQLKVVSRKRKIPTLAWASVLVVIFWATLMSFKIWGPWENNISDEEYMRHMPAVTEGGYTHP